MATLKEIQNTELEMLKYVDQVCSENDIKYVMLGGTLLGAVRHKGFIPWDDDIDIYMSVNDFKKLKKVFKSDKYFLQIPETDRESLFLMAKVRKNGSYMQEPNMDILNIHQGIWIDIFVYTDAAKSEFMKKCQLFAMHVLQSYRCKYYNARKKTKIVAALLAKLPYKIQLWMDHLLNWIVCAMGSTKSSQYLIYETGTHFFFDKTIIQERKAFDFEDCRFWGIKNYDAYLSDVYGADYMTPRRWSHLSDYSNVVIGNESSN